MRQEWLSAMKSAISEVLETMFFIVVDFGGAAGPSSTPCSYQSRIDLVSQQQGARITMRFTAPFALALSSNFLSKDEGKVPEEELKDVLKELTNMIGGVFKGHIDKGSTVWFLGIPVCEALSSLPAGPFASVSVHLDGAYAGDVILEVIPLSR